MEAGELDWATILVNTLDTSPLVLQNTFSKRVQRFNSWQCHILACMFTCLVPRVRAEISDYRICCSLNGKLEQDSYALVQAALQNLVHTLRQAEKFFQACHHDDPTSLFVSTACTGEALTVHLHNLFWSVSGLILATRVALGFPDKKLLTLMDQQVNCWSEHISRYISLGAELLDLKDLAAMVNTEVVNGKQNLFGNMHTETPSVCKLLSCRLKWVLCKDNIRESQIDVLLEDLKINRNELVFKKRFETDDKSKEMADYERASWAGFPVAVERCHPTALPERIAMLLRMRNPFILQVIGWAEGADDKGSSCYMVMEDVHTDLESFIKAQSESKAAQDMQDGLLFPFSEALDMMLQIARGMWYLHRNGIAHTGLQSREVLLRTEDDSDVKQIKLCHVGLPSFIPVSRSSDYAEDVFSFGMLCMEILTGRERIINGAGVSGIQPPASTPVLLSDCLKACGDASSQNRPNFGVICGLLRHLKIVIAKPHHLERLLYFNEAAKAASKSPEAGTPLIKGTLKAAPDDMAIIIQLIDINVQLLHASTPPDLYYVVASESWLAKLPVSFRTLQDVSTQLTQSLQALGAQDDTLLSSPSAVATQQPKFIISNVGALTTSLVGDGYRGLLKAGWASTTLGLGTLETWLHHLSPKWKDTQKVALGVALCLRHVSKTPPRIGFYSHEQGSIDGFYPIHPGNILLNNQLKVALLLDNSLAEWKSLIRWAGVHPQVGEGVENILLSIEAYTTFYFGHLLLSILKVHHAKKDCPTKTTSLSDHHYEFVLTNLSRRCIQLKYLNMTEVVTILLSDNTNHPTSSVRTE